LICPGYIQTEISKNALSPDGTAHGKMDENQAKGMPVDECASRIIRAFEQEKAEVYMGGMEVLGVYLKRFLPGLLRKILVNEAPK
jgi:short-subunit dehydrogenase